jgi:flavin reductase (DIM6/NTAB) family NADH-FMN oxidoreductase RutF
VPLGGERPADAAEWLHIDTHVLDARGGHDLLKSIVLPRPIAWITTLRPNGVTNLAPYSCYAIVAFRPMLVVVGFEHSLGPKQKKDTLRNIERTRELVIHTVTEDLLERMNSTARSAPDGESKLVAAGLTPFPCEQVAPPRIAECPLAMECRAVDIRPLGEGHDLVVAEVLVVHARADIVKDGRIDAVLLRPVGRLGDDDYLLLHDVVTLPRPEPRG